MIPKWKLEREWKRIKEQFQQVPWYIYGKVVKRHYDRTKHKKISITQGRVALGKNVAVLLIYQPKGILESTLMQLDYFNKCGFSTLVVSNAAVGEADMTKLKERSFQILERPNYGYDFGGYRDGVLHILEQGSELQNVIVMNDSVWFPLHKDSDPVGDALKSDADLYGISYFEHLRKPHLSHIQSYFFRFGPNIVTNGYFQQFWQDLPVSSIRNTVIRKCEMQLTESFRSRGYSIGTWSNAREINTLIAHLNDQELKEFIVYLSRITLMYKAFLEPVLEMMDAGENWREEVERLVNGKRLIVPFLIHWPEITVKMCMAPVMKKDKSEPYKIQRNELQRKNLTNLIHPAIAVEIENWDKMQSLAGKRS